MLGRDNFRVCTGNCKCAQKIKPFGPMTRKESRDYERAERFHTLYNCMMSSATKPPQPPPRKPKELRRAHRKEGSIPNNSGSTTAIAIHSHPPVQFCNYKNNIDSNKIVTNNYNIRGKDVPVKMTREMRGAYASRQHSVHERQPALGIRTSSRLRFVKDKSMRKPYVYQKPVLMDVSIHEHLRRTDEQMRLSQQPGYKLRCFLRRATNVIKRILLAASVHIEVILVSCFMAELAAWVDGQDG